MASGITRMLPDRIGFTDPGRWGSGLHRGGGDRAHDRPRREHHHDLDQQRQLRDDGRTDGPHDGERMWSGLWRPTCSVPIRIWWRATSWRCGRAPASPGRLFPSH